MDSRNDVIPRTYDQWRHCITVDCGIALTPKYIEQRLRALSDMRDDGTRRFIALYGRDHHAAVLGWFEQAAQALASGDGSS